MLQHITHLLLKQKTLRLAMFLLFSATCVAAGSSFYKLTCAHAHICFGKQPPHFYNLSHPFLSPLIPPLKKYDC